MGKSENAPERGKSALKILDRYAGIPLVYLAGLFRSKKSCLPNFRSVGLFVYGALGDTILLAGIIADFKTQLPDKEIVIFTTESNYGIARLLSGADRVVKLSGANPFKAVRTLRENKVDVFCDFGPWPRLMALYSWLSGASFLVGFRTQGQYRHYLYDHAVDHSAQLHEIDNYRALVRTLGVESTALPKIAAGGAPIDGLQPESYVVFHAWPGGYKSYLREWPESYWLDLAAKMTGLGLEIVLTGARYDARRAEELCSKMISYCDARVINLAGRVDFPRVASVLKNALAVVSVNTGIMHLAAAVGALVFGLNGPTSRRRWGPLGDHAVSVDAEGDGCGYLNLGFEYKNRREDCMELITPQRVFSLFRKALHVPAPARAADKSLEPGFAVQQATKSNENAL